MFTLEEVCEQRQHVCQTLAMSQRPYHHGDLEAALLAVSMEVVESQGATAVTVRDLARMVGVSPSAAYRHFPSRDHLMARVSQLARQALAAELLTAQDGASTRGGSARRATARFESIGRAYVSFALNNRRLFEAAFLHCDTRPEEPDDPDAWLILVDAIDQMIEAGAVPDSRKRDGPIIAWSGVHGLAQILTASIWPEGISPDVHINAVVAAITRSLR
jgi:AcrR family transcriptional regulator